MPLGFDYRFPPFRNIGAATYTPWKKTRLVPCMVIEVIAFVAIVLIILKSYSSKTENLVHKHIPRTDTMNTGKINQVKTTDEASHDASFVNVTKTVSTVNPAVVNSSADPVKTDIPLWEEPTLLNLSNFKWLVNNESLCRQPEGSTKRLVPILIHTALHHFNERDTIRKSWTSVRDKYKNWDVRPVFLLGELESRAIARNKRRLAKGLQTEQLLFGDLVTGNFIDTYRNLSYKHLMGYKWILNFCPDAFIVLKIDDDLYLDIFDWLDWRSADLQKHEQNASVAVPDLYCMLFGGTKPMREKENKWYASFEDWPEEYYPDYCSGNAYGITVEGIRKIYSVSRVKKFLWVDDAYVTGVLKREAERKYGWKAVVKDVWDDVSDKIEAWRPFCEETNSGMDHWSKKRPFKSIVNVERNHYERDVLCLWKKTLFDRKISELVQKLNVASNNANDNGYSIFQLFW